MSDTSHPAPAATPDSRPPVMHEESDINLRAVVSQRMDGAALGALRLAVGKAYTAVLWGMPSGSFTQSTQPGGEDWGTVQERSWPVLGADEHVRRVPSAQGAWSRPDVTSSATWIRFSCASLACAPSSALWRCIAGL